MNNNLVRIIAYTAVFIAYSASAQAAGTGMPWETVLSQILGSLTGPITKFILVGVAIAAGAGAALSESGGGMRKLFAVVCGLSVICAAPVFVPSLFGFTGGAEF